MTHICTNQPPIRSAASPAPLWRRLLAWRAAARTRARLLRLDDHMLEDIGLVRADLDPVHSEARRVAEEFGRG